MSLAPSSSPSCTQDIIRMRQHRHKLPVPFVVSNDIAAVLDMVLMESLLGNQKLDKSQLLHTRRCWAWPRAQQASMTPYRPCRRCYRREKLVGWQERRRQITMSRRNAESRGVNNVRRVKNEMHMRANIVRDSMPDRPPQDQITYLD
jgi:hypothetical protein